MTKTQKKINNKRTTQAMLLLAVVGVASSFTFILTAVASGIVPSDVITLANNSRAKAGLTALSENTALSQAARSKAEDMLENDYFAHTSPTGVEPWYWIKQAGYQYKAAGENLAINYTDAREQHDAWMKSETHRANIMNTRYRDIGVAVVKGKINGKESIVTVEYFATPFIAVAEQAAPATPPLAAPAIKGVASEPEIVQTPVVKEKEQIKATPSTVPILPVRAGLPRDLIWLSLVCATLLAVCTVAAPLLFIGRAYGCLLRQPRGSVAKRQEGAVEAAQQEYVPLRADAVHYRVWAH